MIDLIPFFILFWGFVNFFVLLYWCLDVEVTGNHLNKFDMEENGWYTYACMFIYVWRNTLGDFTETRYGDVMQ